MRTCFRRPFGRDLCVGGVLSLLTVIVPATVRAGGVDAAGEGLRTPRANSGGSGRGNSSHRSRDDDDDDSDDDDDAFFVQLLALPWTIPSLVIQTAHPVFDGFPDYPHARHLPHGGTDDGSAPPLKPYAFRVGVGGTMQSALLVSGVLHTQLDFLLPVAIRLQYRVLAQSPTYSEPTRWAGLGDFEVLWRFAQSTPVNFYTGLGYTQWADRFGRVHGGAFVYGFETYPGSDMTFGSRISVGPVGESYVLQWRTHLGVMLGRVELQVAFDHVDVAGVYLGGAMLGLNTHL